GRVPGGQVGGGGVVGGGGGGGGTARGAIDRDATAPSGDFRASTRRPGPERGQEDWPHPSGPRLQGTRSSNRREGEAVPSAPGGRASPRIRNSVQIRLGLLSAASPGRTYRQRTARGLTFARLGSPRLDSIQSCNDPAYQTTGTEKNGIGRRRFSDEGSILLQETSPSPAPATWLFGVASAA